MATGDLYYLSNKAIQLPEMLATGLRKVYPKWAQAAKCGSCGILGSTQEILQLTP
jgi:hypothetical protein